MEFSPGHLDFFPPRTLAYPPILYVLISRTSGFTCYLPALCVDGQLLGCKFFETETQAYPPFIPLLSNYQRKGGPECVNGCLFKTKVKEDSPLALFASKGKTGEILDKEHIRDFFQQETFYLDVVYLGVVHPLRRCPQQYLNCSPGFQSSDDFWSISSYHWYFCAQERLSKDAGKRGQVEEK